MAVTPPLAPAIDRPLGIVGSARAAGRNLLEIIPPIAYRQPIISGRTVVRWHMLMDPEGLEQVFKDKVDVYPKSDTTLRIMRPAIGESLFTAEGQHWRWQRRAAAPVFAWRNLLTLTPFMSDAARRTAMRLEAFEGRTADLYEEMVTATFEVICDVAMSGRGAIDRRAVGTSVTKYIETIGRVSLLDVLNVPGWVPRPAQLFNQTGTSDIQRMMDRVIAERIEAPRRQDLMSLMLEAEDPKSGRTMTPEELRDNMMAFLVAGHETTALALAWAFLLIALDQDVQTRLFEEVDEVCGDADPGADHVERLVYTRQVIEEAMRLYPPAGMISRTAREADTLVGRDVRKGDTVIIPIYALHRSHLWWESPDQFNPDNFAPERTRDRNRYLYLPFGAGPRICIGMGFALIEAQIILATLVKRFRFRTLAEHMPKPVMVMTLRPEGGVKLKIERREPRRAAA